MADLQTYKGAGFVDVGEQDILDIYDTGNPTPIGTWEDGIEATVRFLNYDGTVLQTIKIMDGGTPVYTGELPTKPSEGHILYTFNGWSPEVGPVYIDTDYTAQYTSEEVTWSNVTYSPSFFYNGGDEVPDGLSGQLTAQCLGVTYNGQLTIRWDGLDNTLQFCSGGEGYDEGLLEYFENIVDSSDILADNLSISAVSVCNPTSGWDVDKGFALNGINIDVANWLQAALNGEDELKRYIFVSYATIYEEMFHDGGNYDEFPRIINDAFLLGNLEPITGTETSGNQSITYHTVKGNYLINVTWDDSYISPKFNLIRTSDAKRLSMSISAGALADYITCITSLDSYILIGHQLLSAIETPSWEWYDPLVAYNNFIISGETQEQDHFDEVILSGYGDNPNYNYWYSSGTGFKINENFDRGNPYDGSVCPFGGYAIWCPSLSFNQNRKPTKRILQALNSLFLDVSGLSIASHGSFSDTYILQQFTIATQQWYLWPKFLSALTVTQNNSVPCLTWDNITDEEIFDEDVMTMTDEEIQALFTSGDILNGGYGYSYQFFRTQGDTAGHTDLMYGYAIMTRRSDNRKMYSVEMNIGRGDAVRGGLVTYTQLPTQAIRLLNESNISGDIENLTQHMLLFHHPYIDISCDVENPRSDISIWNGEEWINDGLNPDCDSSYGAIFNAKENLQSIIYQAIDDESLWGWFFNNDAGPGWQGNINNTIMEAANKLYNMPSYAMEELLYQTIESEATQSHEFVQWMETSVLARVRTDLTSISISDLQGYMENEETVTINSNDYTFYAYDSDASSAHFSTHINTYQEEIGIVWFSEERSLAVNIRLYGLKGFAPEPITITGTAINGTVEPESFDTYTTFTLLQNSEEPSVGISAQTLFGGPWVWDTPWMIEATSSAGYCEGWYKQNGANLLPLPSILTESITVVAKFADDGEGGGGRSNNDQR